MPIYELGELYTELEAKAEEARAKREEERKAHFAKIREEEEKKNAEWSALFKKAGAKISEDRKAEMERKIQEETEAAAEAIRRKYEAEFPAEWNESPKTKALKKLVKELYPDNGD